MFNEFNNNLNAVNGFGVGFNYYESKREEDETKQGKNFYLSSLNQAMQIASLCNVIFKMTESMQTLLLKAPIRLICNIVPILGYPACLAIAAVKHEHYEHLATKLNTKLPIKIPTQLSPTTVRKINYLAEHLGDMVRVAMIVGALVLITLGSIYYAAGLLTPLIYDVALKNGLVSHRVNLWVETYMPPIADVGLTLGGTIFNRLTGFYKLTTTISLRLNMLIQFKVDAYVRKYFQIEEPTLEELYETPIQVNKNLSFKEMNAIIKSRDDDYEINPYHCVKWAVEPSELPQNGNFDLFLNHFDSIDWTKKYSLILGKLKDDDRFLDYLYNELPEVNDAVLKVSDEDFWGLRRLFSETTELDDVKTPAGTADDAIILVPDKVKKQLEKVAKQTGKSIDDLIKKYKDQQKEENIKNGISKSVEEKVGLLAKKKGLAPNVFLAQWLREQMSTLVGCLSGRIPVTGHQSDMEETKTYCRCILPYLTDRKTTNTVDFEDILLKLSVEGGDYCALGSKRAANELMDNVILDWIKIKFKDDPIQLYEYSLRYELQRERFKTVDTIYSLMKQNFKEIDSKLLSDQHFFETHRHTLSYGFVPLTDTQLKGKGLMDLVFWELANFAIASLNDEVYAHKLSTLSIEQNSRTYLENILSTQGLTTDQRNQILSGSGSQLKRLIFVILGVMRKRSKPKMSIDKKIEEKLDKISIYLTGKPFPHKGKLET